MNFPISADDYAVIESDDKYILFRIHSIIIIDLNNDPKCITHEKPEFIHKELKITCMNDKEELFDLEYDRDDYFIGLSPVFFIRKSLEDYIDEYRYLDEFDPREQILPDETTKRLIELEKSDDFWASRFWNDFLNIKNIRTIISAKPINMTWKEFYTSLINKIDIVSKTKDKKTTVFTPLLRVLGL
jgi:hypothetical protein